MPITSAATSMSRIAIHERPMAPRTRLRAAKAKTQTKPSTSRYFSAGESTSHPKIASGGALTEPEDESCVNHLMRAKAQSRKNCAASVATARWEPLDAKARQAEEDAHERRGEPGEHEDDEEVQVRDAHRGCRPRRRPPP